MIAHPFNPAKLLWHGTRVIEALAGNPTSGPISLEWDLSNTCPHDCPFCSFGTSESQGYRQKHWTVFPTDRALSLIPELVDAGVKSITFTGGGEPLMHKHAAAIMSAAVDAGLQIGLVTNGFLLPRALDVLAEHAVFVRVSLDAGEAATHLKLHRPPAPQYYAILENMRALAAAAADRYQSKRRLSPLTLGASFCVTDDNWQEIGIAARRVRELGGDYLEVRPTYPTEWRGDGWGMALSQISAATRALQDARDALETDAFKILGMLDRFASLERPEKDYRRCQIGPLMTVLGADGRLWHCCVQRGRDGFDLGSVLERPFTDAWRDAQARRMSEWVDVKKCPRCRYDNYNRLLEGVERDSLHLDFV